MTNTRKLWLILTLITIGSFGVLGLIGREIYVTAPPVPARVVSEDGTVLFTGADVDTGRQAWQSAGGMQLGSIWGHGAYLAPDWSADWLHRESVALLDGWSQAEFGMHVRRPAPREAGCVAGAPEAGDGDQPLRCGHRRPRRLGRPRRRDQERGEPLCRPVRRCAGAEHAARAICDAGERHAGHRAPQRDDRVLLLDLVGQRGGTAGRSGHHLHQQLAA